MSLPRPIQRYHFLAHSRLVTQSLQGKMDNCKIEGNLGKSALRVNVDISWEREEYHLGEYIKGNI
jgi:hypothetical protein